jgi:hypothetical protein
VLAPAQPAQAGPAAAWLQRLHAPLPIRFAIDIPCHLTGRGVYIHAPLPVRFAIGIQCASYREGRQLRTATSRAGTGPNPKGANKHTERRVECLTQVHRRTGALYSRDGSRGSSRASWRWTVRKPVRRTFLRCLEPCQICNEAPRVSFLIPTRVFPAHRARYPSVRSCSDSMRVDKFACWPIFTNSVYVICECLCCVVADISTHTRRSSAFESRA